VRVLDTRDGTGGFSAPVGPGATVVLPVAGQFGVPVAGASAVVLNLTATGGQPPGGYVTVYPDGAGPPLASDLNYAARQTIPNLVVVQVGADGKLAFYNGSAGGSVDLVADLVGWYS